MGLKVLLVGRLRPDLGVAGVSEGVPTVDVRHPEAVQAAVAALGAEGDPVLLMCEARETPRVRHQRAWLNVALPYVTTVLEPVPGPPLAVNVVAALANNPSTLRDPSLQLAAVDRLRDQLWSAVWLPSVAKLDRPQPRMAQHLRSWLPGGGFMVVYSQDRVEPVRPGRSVTVDDSAAGNGQLLVADSGSPEWVALDLAASLGVDDRMALDGWRDPRDAFGSATAAEFVLLPAGAHDLDALDERAFTQCWGCGRPNPRPVCAFCGMSVEYSRPTLVPAGPESDRSVSGASL